MATHASSEPGHAPFRIGTRTFHSRLFVGTSMYDSPAILADAVPFLRRGLLPLGNFVAALPVVGIVCGLLAGAVSLWSWRLDKPA